MLYSLHSIGNIQRGVGGGEVRLRLKNNSIFVLQYRLMLES